MVCDLCQNLPGAAWRTTMLWTGLGAGAERLGSMVCHCCGALLPARDQTDRFLRSLSRLAAFGLAAGGSPILKGSQPVRPRPPAAMRTTEEQ
jgi:hypothetical protein